MGRKRLREVCEVGCYWGGRKVIEERVVLLRKVKVMRVRGGRI